MSKKIKNKIKKGNKIKMKHEDNLSISKVSETFCKATKQMNKGHMRDTLPEKTQ